MLLASHWSSSIGTLSGKRLKGKVGSPGGDKGQVEREERFLDPLTFSLFPTDVQKGLLQEV